MPSDPTTLTMASSLDVYVEEDPTVKEFIQDLVPTTDDIVQHVFTVFPAFTWIRKYNLQWLIGDVIAGRATEPEAIQCTYTSSGITVGAILVPQSMAYSHLAGLPPQFGLFSAFVGGATYWLFGTSKDIAIGVCLPAESRPFD
jgi:sodium-independent sulfate anion transporter 11